jgi:23S rRNA maturation mini-RNase III
LETIANDDNEALDFTVGLLDNTMALAFAGDAVIVRNEIQRVVVLTLMARSDGLQSRVATGIFQGNTTRTLVKIRSLRKAHMLGQKFTSESPVGFR